MTVPGYWRHETSGRLRPAVMRFLEGGELSTDDIGLLRAYLRQWIESDVWRGGVDDLRGRIDGLVCRATITDWIDDAIERGADPL